MRTRVWFYTIGALLSGAFILAGALKMRDPAAFAASVATFSVLPRAWSNAVAIILPPFEILCGALLWIPAWRRAAALGLVGLNLAFIALLTQAVARGLQFDCGCFGKWDPIAHYPVLAILRDLAFLAIAIAWFRAGEGKAGAAR
jgi:uncharacterized membrane protein YphA (DoxX/SURF4 family)